MPANRKNHMNRSKRRTGRRHPLATVALLALGLVFTGGAYAALSTGTTAQAEADADLAADDRRGQEALPGQLRHLPRPRGRRAPATARASSASARQPSTSRSAPAACRCRCRARRPQEKPPQFTDEQVKQLAYYVASLGPGPDIPARPPRQRRRRRGRTAPSSSASTARCATTWPAPAARSPRASSLPR